MNTGKHSFSVVLYDEAHHVLQLVNCGVGASAQRLPSAFQRTDFPRARRPYLAAGSWKYQFARTDMTAKATSSVA